ncbi:hypothetical protein ARMSODRAFT_1012859 [Armillaria solidipes]|uniref:CxC2-like cysteine cluster KDZ transposase-associated domain-containing protein n=1 Tax=Armillaria solidipes TaxID=1076256 RepID=A0A2H3C281_9AGAR|nr:hypothetical protein ARMSODRAFT_1012859 [Armillaria solidipes]
MLLKQKKYHISQADNTNNHDINQVQAYTAVLQKGHHQWLKVTPQSVPVHQNPILSQGNWVYQFDPTDLYDPHATAQILKQAGRGNIEDSIKTMMPGQLALQCPACPLLGINLPMDWHTAPLEFQFLYLLILALDANFQLKNLYCSSLEKDPGLHTGLAHFVEPTEYLAHMSKYATQKDINTCSGFKTLSHAESKNTIGLQMIGVRMLVCTHHEVVQPLGVVDLQKGEWYCNIDYIALLPVEEEVQQVNVHVPTQDANPRGHQDPVCMNIHIVGHTDGEEIEQCWAEINIVVNSIKEMGPGNCYNTLNVQFAWHNWKKLTGLGKSLVRCHVKAQHKSSRHISAYLALTDILPNEKLRQEWTTEIEAWEKNNSLPSPYFIEVKHEFWALALTLTIAHLFLARSFQSAGLADTEGGGVLGSPLISL